ncbi:hypothetical protein AX14_001422 [Amanita brunnescens Koide BX004]|nr:hypothetical protein AX14_001422 [Amanita brunnescens Koide BX004]
MHHLTRRVLRLGSLLPARQSVWLCARASQRGIRTYATKSNGNGEKVDIPRLPMATSFDRLFFLLSLVKTDQNQLGKEEMALLIAALFSSTNSQAQLANVAQVIPPLIESYNKMELYARVSELMSDDLEVGKIEETLRMRLGIKTDSLLSGISAERVLEEELRSESQLSQLLLQLETPNAYSEPTDVDEIEFAKNIAEDQSLNPLDEPIVEKNDPFPNLMTPDPLLDSRDELVFPPDNSSPYINRVVVRNHNSIFHHALIQQTSEDPFDEKSDWEAETSDETSEDLESLENLPLPENEIKNLYRFPLIVRRVTQQTGKGKIHRIQYLVVVGNGDGLVGYGQAKDEDAPRALAKATALAIRSMDTVARFEDRTVPTEMETKFGSTRIIMRPRPVGFGLRCNPNLHQVLKAAGIKDVSAKVWGSRNPVSVVKATFRMLWGGHAPLGMGNGVSGKGRKLDKGEGVRSVLDVERDRGRKMVGLRL